MADAMVLRLVLTLALVGCQFAPTGAPADEVLIDAPALDHDGAVVGIDAADVDAPAGSIDAAPAIDATPIDAPTPIDATPIDAAPPIDADGTTETECGNGDDDDDDGQIDCNDSDCPGCFPLACCASGGCGVFC